DGRWPAARQRAAAWGRWMVGRCKTVLGVVAGTVLLVAGPAQALVLFGADLQGAPVAAKLGARPDYGQFWAGAWNERSGWGTVARWTQQLADAGVTPVAQWYYWSGDISPACVSHGCWGHGLWKDRAHWDADAARLADAMHGALHGRRGVVVLESEFNHRGMEAWEPFDGLLAHQAGILRAHAPEVRLVLGFGNWNPRFWPGFDRAAQAVDLVGFQTMRGATRDSAASYAGAVDAIEAAVRQLHANFGKPVLLYDLALSSYWEPQFAAAQNHVLQQLFARLPALERLGLQGVVLRAIDDDPTMTTSEYYGMGERFMGLRHADGTWKPALGTWLAGVKAARAAHPASPSALAWQPRAVGNPWWVEVALPGARGAQMWASVDGGAWHALPATSWGDWAASSHVRPGAHVQFHARLPGGALRDSPGYAWG
ncbi:MAG: hypothetical protein LC624_03370, partial [Halobacteriales archaeon]|nr:hypothetical protein [Halobacteriales archaeon]